MHYFVQLMHELIWHSHKNAASPAIYGLYGTPHLCKAHIEELFEC